MLHLTAHRVPLSGPHPARDAAIGDDLHRVIRHEHVDQHAVVVLGVPHAELTEELQGARPRRKVAPQFRQIESRFHDEADLPAMARFALRDRLLDGCAYRAREVAPRAPARGGEMSEDTQDIHAALPAAGGAAAPEPAASPTESAAAETAS